MSKIDSTLQPEAATGPKIPDESGAALGWATGGGVGRVQKLLMHCSFPKHTLLQGMGDPHGLEMVPAH
jgi:hypothetical protein